MSSQKANGDYQAYSAKVRSLNSLQNKNSNIVKSDYVQVIDDSFLYYEENGSYYFSFDFYSTDEASHSLSVLFEEYYLNSTSNIISEKIEFSSINYINSIDVEVKRADECEPSTENSKFLLYSVQDEDLKEEADLEGFFNNYILNFSNISPEDLSIISEDDSIISVINTNSIYKIVANGIGETKIIISALDGSNKSVMLYFKVCEIQLSQLKVGNIDLLSNYSKEDLDQELENIEFFLDEKYSSSKINILISKYVKESYVYFSSESEDLKISCNNSNQENYLLKTFAFESSIVGNYNINLIVNNVVIYSFVITVKPSYEFRFQEGVSNQNVEYDFENRQITVSDFNDIYFSCFVFKNNIRVEGRLELAFDDYYCESETVTLYPIFLRIKNFGSFNLTITDFYSKLSTTFTIIINE